MKKKTLRQAVDSVKWTDEQRRTIEARLSVPLHHTEDLEDGYTDSVTAISRVLPREENDMDTKTKKTHKKIWMIAALAAALSVGGVTAGVAMRNHDSKGETVQQNETHPNIEMTGVPDIDEQKNKLHLNFVGDAEAPSIYGDTWHSAFWFAQSETGYYLNGFLRMDQNDPASTVNGLYYHDEATGATVPLCARPQCKHDGSEYCVATQQTYTISNLVYYDGWLYTLGYQNANEHLVLLRYAPDGTEIKVMADFGKTYDPPKQTVLYRGNLIILAPLTNGEFLTLDGRSDSTKGFKFIAYELATGKQTDIYSCMPEKDSDAQCCAGQRFWCVGTDIIYENNVDVNHMLLRGVYKISMLDGSIERLLDASGTVYAVSENHLLYSKKPNGFSYAVTLFLSDANGKNEKEIGTAEDDYDSIWIRWAMDKDYIYRTQTDPATQNTKLIAYDLSFKELGSCALPEHMFCIGLSVRDGMVYCEEPYAWEDPAVTESVTRQDIDGNEYQEDVAVSHFCDGYITVCPAKDLAAGTGKLEPFIKYSDAFQETE